MFAFMHRLPLLKFWPEIDKQVLREFADTVPRDGPKKVNGSGSRSKRANRFCISGKRKAPCPTILACPKAIRSLP